MVFHLSHSHNRLTSTWASSITSHEWSSETLNASESLSLPFIMFRPSYTTREGRLMGMALLRCCLQYVWCDNEHFDGITNLIMPWSSCVRILEFLEYFYLQCSGGFGFSCVTVIARDESLIVYMVGNIINLEIYTLKDDAAAILRYTIVMLLESCTGLRNPFAIRMSSVLLSVFASQSSIVIAAVLLRVFTS